MVNQAKYEFDMWDKKERGVQYIIFEVYVPKYLDTSLIEVDLHPHYVRISIKKKILQIRFQEGQEVKVEKSRVLRSQTTGSLQLIMEKVE